jgi:hypothetical protein
MFKHEIAEIAGKGTRQATRQVIANWREAFGTASNGDNKGR